MGEDRIETINSVERSNKEFTFKLPQEKVTVKFIPKKRGLAANVNDDHVIAGGMLDKAVKTFVAPLNQKNGSIKNVLTREEKEYLEDLTGLNLSVYGTFWDTFKVQLRKQDDFNKFDLSDAMSYLQYKILLHYPDIICTDIKKTRLKATYQFCIVKEGDELKHTKSDLNYKKEAFKLYSKIEDDKDMLIGILRLINNKNVSDQSKLDWLQAQVETHVDTKPKSFVSLMKDSALPTKILINKAVSCGAILKAGNKYQTIDGLPLCEVDENPSFNNAVSFLDDPKNEDIRTIVEARVENAS